jgi:TolA-binding protein
VGCFREFRLGITSKKTFVIVLCATLTLVGFASIALYEISSQATAIAADSIGQTSIPKQIDANQNAPAADLAPTIESLRNQILQLEKALTQKKVENQQLKEEVCNLKDSLEQILAELKSIEQNEQIQLLVERLRIEPPT